MAKFTYAESPHSVEVQVVAIESPLEVVGEATVYAGISVFLLAKLKKDRFVSQ